MGNFSGNCSSSLTSKPSPNWVGHSPHSLNHSGWYRCGHVAQAGPTKILPLGLTATSREQFFLSRLVRMSLHDSGCAIRD